VAAARAAARLGGVPGVREDGPRVLVHGDGGHLVVRLEDLLHAVPVVHVEIHVDDRAVRPQQGDRDREIVEHAEAGRGGRHGVVHASGGREGPPRPPRRQQARGRRGRPRHPCGGVEHPGEDGRVRVPEAEPRLGLPRRAGAPDGGEERRVVDELELGVGGEAWGDDVEAVQEAERLGQADGQLEATRVHRVTGAEVVGEEALAPHHHRAHGGNGSTCGRGHAHSETLVTNWVTKSLSITIDSVMSLPLTSSHHQFDDDQGVPR